MSLISDEEWTDFKVKFGKAYKDEVEEKMRRELYGKAKLTIEDHNKKYEAGEVTWTMGINDMSDYTEEEYSQMCGFKPSK